MCHLRLLPSITLLVIGLTAGWLARGRYHAASEREQNQSASRTAASPELPKPPAAATNAKSTTPAKPSAALEIVRKAMNAGPDGDPSLEIFTAEQFATYLERHQRNATSLLAVWALTKDKKVLEEAYEKFPGDPSVALRAFQHLNLPAEEKRFLAARFEQDHPLNPLGPVLAGSIMAKEGQNAEAIAKLREVVSRGPLDLQINSQRLAQREALMSLRKSPLEAQVYNLIHGDEISPLKMYRELARPAVEEVRNNRTADSSDATLSMAGDLLGLAAQVANEPSQTTVARLVAQSLETAALRSLPPDVEIGESGRTAAERIAELNDLQKTLSQAVADVPWHLSHLDEPGLDLYVQILEQRGEREAVKWAEAYHGPAPQRPNLQ